MCEVHLPPVPGFGRTSPSRSLADPVPWYPEHRPTTPIIMGRVQVGKVRAEQLAIQTVACPLLGGPAHSPRRPRSERREATTRWRCSTCWSGSFVQVHYACPPLDHDLSPAYRLRLAPPRGIGLCKCVPGRCDTASVHWPFLSACLYTTPCCGCAEQSSLSSPVQAILANLRHAASRTC